MRDVKVIVLRTAGTNCDQETAFAFQRAGASAELVHVNELRRAEKSLNDYHILALPGGFTYGDDIASGKILANEIRYKLERDVQQFIADGKLIVGICNGFQILVKAGLLPNLAGDFQTIESTLTVNDSAKFEDRWVYLKRSRTHCVWTRGMDDIIYLPVAHGEGKFIPRDKGFLEQLKKEGLIVFRYCDEKGRGRPYPYNPNGSIEDIAGICDPTGRIFGLMPHPERHIFPTQHPRWTRSSREKFGDGFSIFRNGVEYMRKYIKKACKVRAFSIYL